MQLLQPSLRKTLDNLNCLKTERPHPNNVQSQNDSFYTEIRSSVRVQRPLHSMKRSFVLQSVPSVLKFLSKQISVCREAGNQKRSNKRFDNDIVDHKRILIENIGTLERCDE